MVSCIIIDDDKDVAESLSERLTLREVEVLGIGFDGKEAIELYQKVKPDVVFLDINMPKYDGFYAIDEIKKIDPSAVIIIVTASVSDETMKKLKEGNLYAFTKPYNFYELLKKARELTGT